MRSPLVFGATLLALALPTATAAAATDRDRCRPQVVDLGTLPGGNFSIAFAMGPDRVLAGWGTDANGQPRPIRWDHGRAQELEAPTGGAATALDINRAGVIVGRYSQGDITTEQALVWKRERLTVLPGLPGGSGAQARRISDSGLITGSAVDAQGREHAVLWSSGRLLDIGIPRGYDGAFGIDVTDRGEVILNAYNETEIVGFRWEQRRFQRLPGLDGASAQPQVAVRHGGAAGFTYVGENRVQATVWDQWGRPRAFGFAGRGDLSSILATDGAGGYAGVANLEPGGLEHAFVARRRGPLLILPAISGPDGRSAARYLDREGNAAGISDPTGEGDGHATLWTCVWRQAFRPVR